MNELLGLIRLAGATLDKVLANLLKRLEERCGFEPCDLKQRLNEVRVVL
ncbi:hypothetical protein LUTEI9C_50169 [Luteimonas sp. 9C]|nr:hypothetical protein LUTEI9C_50169 [Luteimonas sp. 9C]